MVTQVIAATAATGAATGSVNTLASVGSSVVGVGSSVVGVGSSLIGVGASLKTVMLLHPVSFAAVGGSLLGIVAYRKADNMLRKKYTPIVGQEVTRDEAEPTTSVASK